MFLKGLVLLLMMRGGGGEGGRGNRGGMGMVVRVYKFRYKIFSRRYRKNIIISL